MLPDVWADFEGAKWYAAESLETEGFIHCSFESQIEGVLERYYSGVKMVLLLEIDPKKLDSELRLEKSTNDELFPHIYGKINLDSVLDVTKRELH